MSTIDRVILQKSYHVLACLLAGLVSCALPTWVLAESLPRPAAINGGLVILPLPTSITLDTPVYYKGQRVWTGLYRVGAGTQTRPVAIVGLNLEASGEQLLTLTATTSQAEPTASATSAIPATSPEALLRFNVTAQTYPEQHLTLTETKYVSPDPEQLARFEREAAEQKAAYRVYSPLNTPQWPSFRWPLVGRLSSPFGLRRFFNEEPRAPHLGIDIAGVMGAPALAPADGRVALTGDYFFNGRTVIIDHGQGLFSMLCHFSDIKVNAGDIVHAGDVVGLVGATGRATAPHLHWTVSLNDARIDPRLLLPSAD